MKLTKNFTSEEFEVSATAKANKIDNTVPSHLRDYVAKLAEQLQVIRDYWNAPIIITSGYRCQKLNKLVGGASNSDHLYGAAVDIHTKENSKSKNKELFNLILSLVKLKKVSFRQIINEYDYNWIHVSINNEFNKFKDNQVVNVK